MGKGICTNCKKEKEDVRLSGKSQGLCSVCYRKLIWKRKLVKCPRCERMMPHHAQGLCRGCYSSIFQLEKIKFHNTKRYHNIDHELYKKIVGNGCVICGFSKIVDMHHIDMNHDNNSPENLTALCPNHHKMAHHRIHQKEVFQALKEKGFSVPVGFKDDEMFKSL